MKEKLINTNQYAIVNKRLYDNYVLLKEKRSDNLA
jgi:hypothetical protein